MLARMRSLMILIFVCCVTEQKKRPTSNLNRIVGGRSVEIDEYAYQVSLQLYGSHFCGGSIISETWILTACHCVEDIRKPSYLSVRVGSTAHNTGGKTYTVRKMVKHPNYLTHTCDYDIALLQIKNTINYKKTQVVRLPPQGTGPQAGSMATITGWGALSSGGSSPRNLHMVQVPIVGQSECRRYFEQSSRDITDRMICAGYKQGGKDSCQGDSGGPLVIDNLQYGVVSWGFGCAFPDSPGIYTNIANLRSWITAETGV